MTPGPNSDVRLFRRLLSQLHPYRLSVALILLLELAGSGLTLLLPVPLVIAVDCVIGSHPLPAFLQAILPASITESKLAILLVATLMLVGITLLSRSQMLVSTLLRLITSEKLVLSFRSQLFRHAQRLSLSYHDSKGTADSIYRIQYDATSLQHIAIDGVIPLITESVTLVVMLFVIVCLDWQLALVALTIAPALFVVSSYYRRRLRKQSKEVKSLESSILGVVQEVLVALRVVKAFGQEDREQERYVDRSREGVRARVRLAFHEGLYGLLIALMTALGTAAVLYVGVRHVLSNELQLGQLLLVVAYLGRLYEPLKTLSKKAASLQSHLASAERAFALLDEAPEVAEKADALALDRARGEVAFQDVSFAYRDGQPVLQNLSFEVPAGTRVGIAGTTGAGKTTLVNLLARFYDPTSGQILLDGRDLRAYRLDDLRSQFAIVLQDPVLFSASIAENIAYARADATEEQIIAAAKAANAHDFITQFAEGYQTRVGERGMRLSGGERQRIGLARAFLKDAPILILDEPTSSVDVKTERVIMEALERLMQDRTCFMIAHRLSTLETCDVVLQIEAGRLAEAVSTTA